MEEHMRRKITKDLLVWKEKKSNRMPLLIYGARQVGKTYSIREFGEKHYQNVIYLNLEIHRDISDYFAETIEPAKIVRFLEAVSQKRISPRNTLIILDEIQACPRALTALKYFREEMPDLHIIGAGSLLGIAINRSEFSFPVGNVDSLTMYPMDFEEYLWAINEEKLCEMIGEAFEQNKALPFPLHQRAMEIYRQYLIVGGMPLAVDAFVETNSFLDVLTIQDRVLNDYISDMAKYASNADSVKIRAVFNSIPVQLAKENKKFQYKLAQKGGTANIFGVAIEWLEFSGVVIKAMKIEHAMMPIYAYQDAASFKIYMGDVGLLTLKCGISLQVLLSSGEADNTFLGAISENYVAQALNANGYKLCYWATDGKSELDFVIQRGEEIIPIEVKTGKRTKSKSMNSFATKYEPAYSIHISSKNFGFENQIKSVPLYAVYLI
jgi:predicted AAA+ superfamily ATPase